VTFIGWIKAQAEDVEFHRLEGFHFTMGAQEVNQGMDLGQEMGEGQPGKLSIPLFNKPLVLRERFHRCGHHAQGRGCDAGFEPRVCIWCRGLLGSNRGATMTRIPGHILNSRNASDVGLLFRFSVRLRRAG
jgi:hypothetical protein